jgi:shikimate dehydrogenase
MMRKKYSLGLIGYPVSHSLSPRLHHAALGSERLEGEYRLYPIAPEDVERELPELFGRMRTGEVQGLNVTIPHKQTVISYLDELTPTAQVIGAVNTIFLRDGKLIGDNTDAPGFLADLKRFFASFQFSVPRKNALVLGAGGSARAVVYALLQDGWHITLAARRREQAQALKDTFSQSPISDTQYPISNLQSVANRTPMSLIINTTPLGMTPLIDTSPWPAALPFPKRAAVYDLVYNPPKTVLVHTAQTAGLPATTGIGMLIEQAALAFELWTGKKADREVMCEVVKSL